MEIVKQKGKVLKLTLTDGSIQLLRGIKDWAISDNTVTYKRLNDERGTVEGVTRVVSRAKHNRRLLAVKHPKLQKVYVFDSVQAFLNTHAKSKWPKIPTKGYIHANLNGMHVNTEWTFFYININEL
jgi:hypothetical protein